MNESYRQAGVNINAGYEAVNLYKTHVKKTFIPGVMSELGGFGGLFDLSECKVNNPVLVSGTDGVGTKLKIAIILDIHETIGQDCVAMCTNDVICCGAKPLFFLDYVAVGRLVPKKLERIVKGIADGCLLAECALIGGETAEMPGFYGPNEYDVAGFCVGIVDKEKIIDGRKINPGDKIIGLASSGVHSNGFSLIRKALNLKGEEDAVKLSAYIQSCQCNLGEELLRPTKIYVKPILNLIEQVEIKGICHITGGGFNENVPRMLPENCHAKIYNDSWPVSPIFNLLREMTNINDSDMFDTFNMGIGMMVTVAPENVDRTVEILNASGEKVYVIGEIAKGARGVSIC